jgi:predicted permease
LRGLGREEGFRACLVNGFSSMAELARDLRFAVRLLKKSPVFTVTVVLLLAVGISANTLMFSVINALLLKPLPVSNPENLVRIVEVHPTEFLTWDLPYDFCGDVAAREADFSEVLCQGEADVGFRDGDLTERVRIHFVSPNFFASLGVNARLGRALNPDDERLRAMSAVVSYDFWKRRLHGDVSAIGRTITLGGHPFTVVGVAPEGFHGLTVETEPDVRVPASVDRFLLHPDGQMNPEARPLFAQVFARLRRGVFVERASAQADGLLHEAYEAEEDKIFPPVNGASRDQSEIRSKLKLEGIRNGVSTLRAQFSRGLEVLMAGVALLLLLACANVAGLLLARAAMREQEMSVRLALGASAARIVRQLLTEGLLVSLLGGALGTFLTLGCLPLIERSLPPIRDRGAVLQPMALHIGLDWHVLGFALAVTVLSAVLFAVSPALRSARTNVASALRTTRSSIGASFTGNLLVTAEVALSTVILIGAALLVATLDRMRNMNPGFDADRVVTFTIDPTVPGYTPAQTRIFSKALLEKAQALPGADSVALAGRGVMRGTGVKATLGVMGAHISASDFLNSSLNEVTPGYFGTMGMHLVTGENFGPHTVDKDSSDFANNAGAPYSVIVNQTFARRFFPGKNPLGERFGSPGPGGVATGVNRIIGVVTDAKYRSLREPVPPTAYKPRLNGFKSGFILNVRTRQNPEAMMAPVRDLLRSLDPEMPFTEMVTLREEVEASLWQERLLALLSTVFGIVAALLASIGLYGALDYAVKSRTREIGVRMALGAQPTRIIGIFSREALLRTAVGVAFGLCLYAVAAVWIRRVLFDLQPWDARAILSVLALVGLISIMASVPAIYRAVTIEPATALRAE